MFSHSHYVPLMRTKPAELRALKALDSALCSLVTPVVEWSPRYFRNCQTPAALQQRLAHVVSHLTSWAGRSVFFDFSARSAPPDALERIAVEAVSAQIQPVPMVNLKLAQSSAYARSVLTLVEHLGTALCLKVSPEELSFEGIGRMIDASLGRYGVVPSAVHLVVDHGGVDAGSLRFREFAHRIPSIDAWRTLTLLSGSFPEDLTGLAPRKTHRLRRFEWEQWEALDSWSGRRPAFGDYSVQHVEPKAPVVVPNFSASIRYTLEDQFLVLRGEGVNNEGGPGYGQWNGWAQLLVEMPEFCGETFSAGDRYILDRATDWTSSGNAQSWLQAAFSHHLTTAALQVAGRLEAVRSLTAAAYTAASVPAVVPGQPGAPR